MDTGHKMSQEVEGLVALLMISLYLPFQVRSLEIVTPKSCGCQYMKYFLFNSISLALMKDTYNNVCNVTTHKTKDIK